MRPIKIGITLAFAGSLAAIAAAADSPRQRLTMDFGWKFMLGDPAGAEVPAYGDSSWQAIDLPHDWSIHLAFDPAAPSGRAGAFLPTGIGWYRKTFRLPQADAGKLITVEFDGIRERGEVWINGHLLGQRPYGYTSVAYDMTPYLNFGDTDNVLAVRADNSHQPNSRWYAGSGIYRHTWLLVTDRLHIPQWGTQVTTPEVTDDRALVSAAIQVMNNSDKPESFILDSMLIDSGGFVIQTAQSVPSLQLQPGTSGNVVQAFAVGQPHLWSIERPEKYTLRAALKRVGNPDEVVDEVDTPFGIRSIAWDVDRGFILNGVPTKLNGVCLHADGGSVGVAVPAGVWMRRLKLLKAMGCNAIRVSHNPPDPEFLDLCDDMGFCVMDEAYDEWEIAKMPQGCHLFFDEWHVRDTTDFIRRDRNHPSVVIWSAGNEIPEQVTVPGTEVLRGLVDIFHKEDPTRPVTAACDRVYAEPVSARPEFMALLDVAGYNYVDRWRFRANLYYDPDRRQFPDRKFIGTESVAMSGARGEYGDPFPPAPPPALAAGAPTASPAAEPAIRRARQGSQPRLPVESLWKFVRVHDYVAGDFMWTGIDYLGEGGVGSTAGMLDTSGFRKDGYYFYQSQWMSQPMVHVFPHWNWQGHEGQRLSVYAYTNCDTVELFLNGQSMGVRGYEFPREGAERGWNSLPARSYEVHTTNDLHLTWDVVYEPGTLRAVGRRAGKVVAVDEIATTGSPAAVKLTTDRSVAAADGRDVIHAVVEIVDDQGRTVPTADDEVTFDLQGEARIIGVDSGSLSMQESFQGTQRHAFHGMCLAILQTTRNAGTMRLTARAQGLREATAVVTSQAANEESAVP